MGDVVWLRRDQRRADLPILSRADESGAVTVAFVVDPSLWDTPAGSPRRRWLATTLLALRETYEGRLTLRTGASNQHGWQWVAGTGTDAAPYFRIFNSVLQGERFDPDATYIRRWIPELSGLETSQAHQPWTIESAARNGYPEPIVDLNAERRDALARHQAARS